MSFDRDVVTTMRITMRQWEALKHEAHARAVAAGGGKADASALLRDILDDWIDDLEAVEAADRAKAEWEVDGRRTVPWEEIKRKLDLYPENTSG